MLKIVTEPSIEPVSLSDMKDYLRVGNDADDDIISGLLRSARMWAESYTGRAFITQEWALTIDGWPKGRQIILPKPPSLSVVSIKIFDADGNSVDMDSDTYDVVVSSDYGRISLKDSASWPTLSRDYGAVEIDFLAGYGADAESVPAPITNAIMRIVAMNYERRGDDGRDANYSAIGLLNPYRCLRMA